MSALLMMETEHNAGDTEIKKTRFRFLKELAEVEHLFQIIDKQPEY